MTIQEINDLRREGRIEEAYRGCLELYEQYPDDRYVRAAMAWCLKSKCEQAAPAQDVATMVNALRLLGTLKLEEIGEQPITNRFSWEIKRLFDSLQNQPDVLIEAANRIFATLPALSFVKPHRYYTLLAEAFTKVKGRQSAPWAQFADFMDWFGFENLLPEDYNPIPLQNGRRLQPVAERVHTAYYKALTLLMDNGTADTGRIEQFIDRLSNLAIEHPEYQFIPYHKALLLLKLGRQDEAREAILPFVRRKQSEFWAWDVLSETTDEPAIKLSCYCKALTCRTQPQFLSKVRLKAAKLMHQLGYDGNARTEIRNLRDTYQATQTRIPNEVIQMVREPWYQAAEPPESNNEFYRSQLRELQPLLYADTPEVPILITAYNEERSICNFATPNRQRGYFSTRHIRGRFIPNRIYLARFDGEIRDNQRATVMTIRQVDDPTPYVTHFFKKFNGTLRVREDNNYGFVDNVYIGPSLLRAGIASNTLVEGTAVISYNRNRESWGWRGVSIRLAENDDR